MDILRAIIEETVNENIEPTVQRSRVEDPSGAGVNAMLDTVIKQVFVD